MVFVVLTCVLPIAAQYTEKPIPNNRAMMLMTISNSTRVKACRVWRLPIIR